MATISCVDHSAGRKQITKLVRQHFTKTAEGTAISTSELLVSADGASPVDKMRGAGFLTDEEARVANVIWRLQQKHTGAGARVTSLYDTRGHSNDDMTDEDAEEYASLNRILRSVQIFYRTHLIRALAGEGGCLSHVKRAIQEAAPEVLAYIADRQLQLAQPKRAVLQVYDGDVDEFPARTAPKSSKRPTRAFAASSGARMAA